jgi:serine/threonine protein kinase
VTLTNITPPSVVSAVPSATVSPTAAPQQSAVAGVPQQQLPVTRPAFLAPAQQVVAAAYIPAPSAQPPSTTATAANAPASSTTTAQPRKGPSPAEIHSNWMSASTKMGTSTLVVRGITYMMLGRIGSGGSSKVYKVLSSANFNVYAMKVVFLEGQDEGTLEQYKNEVRYLREFAAKAKLARETGDLNHHNTIIELVDFEVNEKEKRLYIVLEYAELDLHKLLKSYGGILINNLNMLRYFWEGMLRAVQTVHEHRVVHSDLKPPNFVVVKGAVKIIDFGIAKAINQNTTNIVRQDIGMLFVLFCVLNEPDLKETM